MVLVRLSASLAGNGKVEEKTYTHNLSSRGARLCSIRNWQPGEQVTVAPGDLGPPVEGEVVYCEKSRDARFFVGLKLHPGRARWRIF